ncbi:MAG TPA: PhzF family phenazine biosynthesis protein [Cytophagales bacterium]|nr:PhzF family phenazine biosynthesis protein [Cytophagales bacterium]
MKITTVDAFTNKPFSGNPAGVVVLEKPAEEVLMQNIASEMNLAETAFLYPLKDGFHLRWFTPQMEVKLCGHATLASAHVLWEKGYLPKTKQAVFHTLSGKLIAKKKEDWITLDFPAIFLQKAETPEFLKEGLGVEIIEVYAHESGYLIVGVENENIVRELNPDFNKLTEAGSLVIVTTKSSYEEFDFISRVFAPAFGINEDPVTGAAHCCLAPYWSEKLGKRDFVAYQASKRGGLLKLRLEGNRVKLTGQAISVLEGELNL